MASDEVTAAPAGNVAHLPDPADNVTIPQSASFKREREQQARDRLAAELARIPAVGSTAFASWLASADVALVLASGALVHLLRRAVACGDTRLQEHLFVALLRHIERQNTRWAARSLARTPLTRLARLNVREELKQELTLVLWQRIAREHDEAWELYFSRALDFAQRHVAHAFLMRHGYWLSTTAPQPILSLSALLAKHTDDHLTLVGPPGVGARDELGVAELADLRELVQRLPSRERVAIVMRFWLAASEHEIASALGVTTRTVRNLVARALTRLRRQYGERS